MQPAERLARQMAFLIECDRLKEIVRQQAVDFRALWDEFEARATADARFAHAIDRCQAMLLNCVSKGVTWSRHKVTVEQVRARNAPIGDGAAALWTHMSGLLEEVVQAGHLTQPAAPARP